MAADVPDVTPANDPTPAPPRWENWTDEQLLDLRFQQLDVTITGSWLAERIEQLYGELTARGLTFRPHFWLSDEWFTPDGMTGVAIPFYLAHPRLSKLEENLMLEVEGGTPDWCMKILRHEAGHAIDNAFRLQRRRQRQKLFGRNSVPYPEYYAPKPYSKSFVLHLDSWYAQSHPAEDFAETFAVWLTPDSEWRTRYADWPALKKLEYMDELMAELAGKAPLVTEQNEFEPLSHLRQTLRQHYKQKRAHYGLNRPDFYDRDLRRLFTTSADTGTMTAARFVSKVRKDVRRRVAAWTGIYQYTIDQVLEDIASRCKTLKLRLRTSEEQTRLDFTALLTVQTMNYLHSGRHRVAL
ncbi:MAG: putative zinc-binding metallopeptidase [Vicinamibacterales bacterium]